MKWVTALNLEQWATTIGSRTTLSEIVSALIRASATDVQSFRFPTGDSAQLPGYDGRLTAAGVPPYVPNGDSVWEFGVTRDYFGKANGDYRDRRVNPRGVVCANTTFVFVTAWIWDRADPSPEQWEHTKKAEGIWKDVKVIDAVALEDWLDQHPAVASHVARFILNRITETGARCTDEFWEEYAARFKPTLTEKVLLCDREDQAKALLAPLNAGAQDLLWRADSPDEVIAFVVAAMRRADPEIRKFLEARTLILDTEDAARQVARHENRIYIPRGAALSLSGLLANHNPTIIPLGRDSARGNATALNRPTTRALSTALETMGYDSEAAYHLARTCGRSVTILARRIPNGDAGKPVWADGTRTLIPALLSGGWDTTSDGDKEVLRILANDDRYETYEQVLRPKLRLQDPPIDQEGSVWKVRAPVDAFVHLAYMIGPADLENLRRVALDVFSEVDPALEHGDDDRPFLRDSRTRLRHSEWLRDGLATTLLQIAVLHQEAELTIAGATPQAYVDSLIGSLDGLRNDFRLIASLRNQLPLLMETAPRPLLSALEHLLEGKGEGILPIFRSGGMFSPTSPHTYVLWALEALAWEPNHLSRVALILAKLARVDPGVKTLNRPINSLREIFLSWHPNTNASLVQRLAVLDQVIASEPEVGWLLIVNLLPENSDISHPTSRPRLKEAGASEREVLTYGMVYEAQRGIVRRALDLVGNNIGRWSTVIWSMCNFEPMLREQTYNKLDQLIATADAGWRLAIWKLLLKEANRHRAFSSAQWALKEPDLARIDVMLKALEPTDVLERHAWLFDSDLPDLPIQDIEHRIAAVDDVRAATVKEIRETRGDHALLAFVDRVQFPQFIAVAAVKQISEIGTLDLLLDDSLGKSKRLDHFAIVLSAEANQKFPDQWPKRIIARAQDGRWNADQIASLMLAWPDIPMTWDLAELLGARVAASYWEHKNPWRLKGDIPDVERAVRKYLAVGRPIAGLEAALKHLDNLPLSLLFDLLDAAITELSGPQATPTHVFLHQVGEVFKRLASRADVPLIELAKREYAYLPLLSYQERQLTLHRLMAEEPAFYVNVVSDVFRPASGEPQEPNDEQRARANAGYRLLSSFDRIPGREGNNIDAAKLNAWVEEVRRVAAEADRARIADTYIGHLLAHAPADPNDGAWPHIAVRQLIEALASEDVETGVRIERLNMRGAYSKAMFEGGQQERNFADKARTWAKATAAHPRTTALLHAIGESWDAYATSEDVRARQDQMRYE